MKFVLFCFLALAAIGLAGGLAIALVLGASSEVVGGLLIALSVLVLATFVLSRLKGILKLELDRRLPRALLTHDRR
jgi:hypothetical protein